MAIFNVTNNADGPNSFNSWIADIKLSHDNDLLVYGNFTLYNTTSANNIIKIDTNGDIQEDFDYGVGFTGGYAFSQTGLAVDGSGDMYVGGQFSTYRGDAAKNIVKINNDGTRDATFVYGTGITGSGSNYSLRPTILPGGDIIYVGRGTIYNGTTTNRLIKVSPLGVLDTSYDTNVGAGFDNVSIQAIDGGAGVIYVHGYFDNYAGTVVNHLAKINADGTLDTAFDTNVGTGFNNASANNYMDGLILNSGDLLMCGLFSDYNGTTVGKIAKLSTAGLINTTFNTNAGTGFGGGRPYYLSYDSVNDKILVTGDFTTYDGVAANNIIVLNSDGTRDTSFNFIPTVDFGPEVGIKIGDYWYIAYNNYSSGRYYIIRVDENGNKIFI